MSSCMPSVPYDENEWVRLSIALPNAVGHVTEVLNGLANCNGKKNMRFLAHLTPQLRIKSLSSQMSKPQSKTGNAFLRKCGLMDKRM